ncbi:myb-like protein X isoform X2 [Clytia hemisphaerica]|uniref:Zinc finger CCHC domain-containing protein 7 n=1 Tax=Clytia hemisphaerica TaxID=252671 RepID=A0A7M5UKH8_9CNID
MSYGNTKEMSEDEDYEEDIYTEEELEEQEQREQEKELEDFLYSKFHYASKVDVEETDPNTGIDKNRDDIIDENENPQTAYPEISESTTWGILGAHSTIKEKINSLSAVVGEDSENWDVNEQDLNEKGNKKHATKRYYLEDELPNIICFNCGLKGHIGRDCTQERKLPTCSLCGTDGHVRRHCPNEFCFNCMETGHRARDCTEERKKPRHLLRCKRCRNVGHLKQDCPEYWRQYHVTIESGPIIMLSISSKSKEKSNKENRYCFNCASTKHFGEECKYDRLNKGPVCGQFVVNYDPCTTEGHEVSKRDKSKRDKERKEKESGEKRKESRDLRESRRKNRDSSPIESPRKSSREKIKDRDSKDSPREKSTRDSNESPKDSLRSRDSKKEKSRDEKEKSRTESPSDLSMERDKKRKKKKEREESPITLTSSSKNLDKDEKKKDSSEKEKDSKKRKRDSEKEEKTKSTSKDEEIEPSKKKSKSSKDKESEKKDEKQRSYENIRRNMWISDDDNISIDRTESSEAPKKFSLADHLKIGFGLTSKKRKGESDVDKSNKKRKREEPSGSEKSNDKKRKTKTKDENEQSSSQSSNPDNDIDNQSKTKVKREKTISDEKVKIDKTLITEKTDQPQQSKTAASRISNSTSTISSSKAKNNKTSEWMEKWEDYTNDAVNEDDEKYELLQRVDSSEVTEIVIEDDENSNDSVATLDFDAPTTRPLAPNVILIDDDEDETSHTTQEQASPLHSPERTKVKPNKTISESPRSKKYKMNVEALNNLKTILDSDSDSDSDDEWADDDGQQQSSSTLNPQPNFHDDDSDVSVTEVVSLDGGDTHARDVEERTTLDYNQTPRVSPTTPPTFNNIVIGDDDEDEDEVNTTNRDLTYYDPRAVYQEHLVIYNLVNATQTVSKLKVIDPVILPDTSPFSKTGKRLDSRKQSSAPKEPFFIPWINREVIEGRMKGGLKMYANNDLKPFAKRITIRKWKAEAENYKEKLIEEEALRRGMSKKEMNTLSNRFFNELAVQHLRENAHLINNEAVQHRHKKVDWRRAKTKRKFARKKLKKKAVTEHFDLQKKDK